MSQKIVILTGAGISAESGIKTFRASDGLWENHRVEDVASPEGFARDPVLVHSFYNGRRRQLLSADIAPNAAHTALARLEREFDGDVLVVTQNIDDLHERAGSHNVIHMHGELLKQFCAHCETRAAIYDDSSIDQVCEQCGREGGMRPDIVWFGEVPYRMDEIIEALSSCDVFVSIGTSGHVYPAAGFVQAAQQSGAKTLELNLELSMVTGAFDESRQGPASVIVPKWVDEVLA